MRRHLLDGDDEDWGVRWGYALLGSFLDLSLLLSCVAFLLSGAAAETLVVDSAVPRHLHLDQASVLHSSCFPDPCLSVGEVPAVCCVADAVGGNAAGPEGCHAPYPAGPAVDAAAAVE